MNDIVERCQQVDQLEQHRLISWPQPCRMNDMLSDLKHNSWAPDRLLINTEPLPASSEDLARIIHAHPTFAKALHGAALVLKHRYL